MRNLIRKIAPFFLIGMLAGPAYADKPIDLGNGFHVESLDVAREIDLLTSIQAEEIKAIIRKVGRDYKIEQIGQTSKYDATPIDQWNGFYNKTCKSIDNGDRFISEVKIQKYLDKLYNASLKFVNDDEIQ